MYGVLTERGRKYWNKAVSITGLEIENMLGCEFVIEDGQITEVIRKEDEE